MKVAFYVWHKSRLLHFSGTTRGWWKGGVSSVALRLFVSRAYVVSARFQLPIESQLRPHAIFPQQRIKKVLPPPTMSTTTTTTTMRTRTRTTTRKVSREIIKILITQLYGKLVDPISQSQRSQVAAQGKEYSQSQLGPQSLFTSAALWLFGSLAL